MRRFYREHPLATFFIITFLLSWALWIPYVLDQLGVLPGHPLANLAALRLLGTLGPALGAIITASLYGGKLSVKALLAQLKRWRVRWSWYIIAGLVFPVLLLLAALIYTLLPGVRPLPFQQVTVSGIVATAVFLVISVLGEEIGWRGWALPHLQSKYTALVSSLLLGTIWTLWHLPFWTALGELTQFGAGYWLLSWAFITGGSIFITWMMNNTGNALPMVLVFHWTYNLLSVGFLPLSSVVPAYIVLIILVWLVSGTILIAFGPKRLRKSPNLTLKGLERTSSS
jgi:uncharacterized protein